MTHSLVTIQIAPESVPSTPSWLAEVVAVAQMLTHVGILKAIQERVRFARARFGHYDVIDSVVVLIGYAVSQAIASPPVQATPQPPPKTPEPAPRSPVLWGDWPRSQLRRRWMKVMRTAMVSLMMGAPPPEDHTGATDEQVITRAQRAHWRLSWDERVARNARPSTAPALEVTIHGLPATFANVFGFGLVNVA